MAQIGPCPKCRSTACGTDREAYVPTWYCLTCGKRWPKESQEEPVKSVERAAIEQAEVAEEHWDLPDSSPEERILNAVSAACGTRRKRQMSPEARAKISAALSKRHAEKRAAKRAAKNDHVTKTVTASVAELDRPDPTDPYPRKCQAKWCRSKANDNSKYCSHHELAIYESDEPIRTEVVPRTTTTPPMLPAMAKFTVEPSIEGWTRFVGTWRCHYPSMVLESCYKVGSMYDVTLKSV